MTTYQWQVGQEVAVYLNGQVNHIGTVEKVTKTGRAYVNGEYYLPDGYRLGNDSWHWRSIKPLTDDLIDKIIISTRRQALVTYFSRYVDWGRLNLSTLIRIAEALGVES